VTVALATPEEVLKLMTGIRENPSSIMIKIIINTMNPHQTPRRLPEQFARLPLVHQLVHIVWNIYKHLTLQQLIPTSQERNNIRIINKGSRMPRKLAEIATKWIPVVDLISWAIMSTEYCILVTNNIAVMDLGYTATRCASFAKEDRSEATSLLQQRIC
jgi:hypothetical protein